MAKTRISAAGIFSRGGFTLIELVVVLTLLAMAVLLVFPRLPDTGGSALKGGARSVASTVRYLFDTGGTGKTYRLTFSPGSSRATVAEIRSDGTETAPTDPFLCRQILPDGVVVMDLQTPRTGKKTTGEVSLDFASRSGSEPVAIHLRGAGGKEMSVTLFPYGRRVTVSEGYKEPGL